MPAILSVENQSLRSQVVMLGRRTGHVKTAMGLVVGHFHDVDFAAEPGGTCRRVDKRHKRPVAGATGLGAIFPFAK